MNVNTLNWAPCTVKSIASLIFLAFKLRLTFMGAHWQAATRLKTILTEVCELLAGFRNMWKDAVLCSWIPVQIPGEDIAPGCWSWWQKNKQWRSDSSVVTALAWWQISAALLARHGLQLEPKAKEVPFVSTRKGSGCGLLATSVSPLHNLNSEDKDAFHSFFKIVIHTLKWFLPKWPFAAKLSIYIQRIFSDKTPLSASCFPLQ